MHRDAASVGHPPDGPPAVDAARPRVLEGVGAAGVDPHPAERAAAAVAAGHHVARQGHG